MKGHKGHYSTEEDHPFSVVVVVFPKGETLRNGNRIAYRMQLHLKTIYITLFWLFYTNTKRLLKNEPTKTHHFLFLFIQKYGKLWHSLVLICSSLVWTGPPPFTSSSACVGGVRMAAQQQQQGLTSQMLLPHARSLRSLSEPLILPPKLKSSRVVVSLLTNFYFYHQHTHTQDTKQLVITTLSAAMHDAVSGVWMCGWVGLESQTKRTYPKSPSLLWDFPILAGIGLLPPTHHNKPDTNYPSKTYSLVLFIVFCTAIVARRLHYLPPLLSVSDVTLP